MTTTKQIVDNSNLLWDVIESLPRKTVAGGTVDIHLCCEVCTGTQQSWSLIAEQIRERAPDQVVIRSQVFGSEAEARAQFEKVR